MTISPDSGKTWEQGWVQQWYDVNYLSAATGEASCSDELDGVAEGSLDLIQCLTKLHVKWKVIWILCHHFVLIEVKYSRTFCELTP